VIGGGYRVIAAGCYRARWQASRAGREYPSGPLSSADLLGMNDRWKAEWEAMRAGPRPVPRSSMPQFRIATLLLATAAVAAFLVLVRFEFPASIVALGILFSMLVFAGDIWKWLPR
jgi:hypothetical protein